MMNTILKMFSQHPWNDISSPVHNKNNRRVHVQITEYFHPKWTGFSLDSMTDGTSITPPYLDLPLATEPKRKMGFGFQ